MVLRGVLQIPLAHRVALEAVGNIMDPHLAVILQMMVHLFAGTLVKMPLQLVGQPPVVEAGEAGQVVTEMVQLGPAAVLEGLVLLEAEVLLVTLVLEVVLVLLETLGQLLIILLLIV